MDPNPSSVSFPKWLSERARLAGGQPISQLMAQALAHPELISLAAGFVDQVTLPVDETRTALEAMMGELKTGRAALQYGTTPGYLPLREAILQRMVEADQTLAEVGLGTDQVVITAGSNQLLHLVGEILLNPGDIVLCAAPAYFVFLGMLANQGARSIGVATDEQGMIPEALEETLARLEKSGELARVKAIYSISYFDNPCSVSLAADRRPQIVELAKRFSRDQQRIYVIEDAAYRELRYSGDDLPSLRAYDEEGNTVIVAGTFSKSFSPGIRVGWGVLPPELVGPVCDFKGNVDFGSPNFAQHLMYNVIHEGLFDHHIETLRVGYRLKLQAMLEAADQHFGPLAGVRWIRPEGGLYVWLTLPEHIDAGSDSELFRRAMEAGVLYVPGEYFFPREGVPQQKNTIRLSFGVQPAENIRRGISALASAIASLV